MLSQEIRRKFIDYYKRNGHTVVPSASVVPHDDPTLLFINAGMNQFKDVFLGQSKRDYTRATSTQKCIRVGGKHNDLDNVGHTSRHLTFFEMLGNFSFGDYFKKEAIAFAWEVTTEIFEFAPEKLWITIFEDDDEAYELWKPYVPENRIVRMGEKDNFWSMGETGPCGPCSELYYDRGSAFGDAPNPKEDATEERYLEFWNLVFMQFNRDQNGKMHSLPNQSIDTGAGLERIISLMMGVDNVFHTDILRHIISKIEEISGRKYDPSDEKIAPAFHVIADHIRSLAFAIADGAQPSNIERGYVLRKLLRRAVRYGRTLLGVENPFLADIFPALIETMGEDFQEITLSKDRISEILTVEEEGFIRTLQRGGNILSTIVEKALQSPHKQISGEDAFKLKDTYGFPLEEILLIAKDTNLQVNIDSYQLLEEKAKVRSRSARTVKGEEVAETLYADFTEKHGECSFVGYSETKAESEVIAIVQGGEFVDTLTEGSEGTLILKETPFYAEKGGQVADTGILSNKASRFQVQDCRNPYPGVIIHTGVLELGTLSTGDSVTAAIDEPKRQNISAHHTATHLLHWALQQVLGPHIKQAGSLVEANRFRFDFNHHKSLTPEEIRTLEDLVNEKIRENLSISTYEIPFDEAQNHPEIKQFFGEKYGSHVRVVDINYSKELCGGTHAYHVGMLGYFRITKESSIAAGIRRIEASCGKAAEEFVRKEEALLQESATLLKAQPTKLTEKVSGLLDENSSLKTQVRSLKRVHLRELAQSLSEKREEIGGKSLVLSLVDVDAEDLSELADDLLAQLKSGVVALAVNLGTRAQLVIKVSPDLIKEGISAVSLIKEASPSISGGGGGRPDAAQAGGKNPDGIDAAFTTIKDRLQ
ncbi:MAG: Alanine--tRNA ligase [Chlamydiae bacterium]|nr:Alanine--tRNA ligase [Chlamydiota bacterium]